MINYEAIVAAVNKEIRAETGLIGKEQENAQQQLAYPFFTYSVISPFLNAKTFKSSGDTQIQDVEIVISYQFYSEDNSFQVMSFAQRCASMLESIAKRQILKDKGIAVVSITDLNKRDNFISIEVERRAGFDLRIRTRHSDAMPFEYFDTISTGG